jgi:hypothetical protein
VFGSRKTLRDFQGEMNSSSELEGHVSKCNAQATPDHGFTAPRASNRTPKAQGRDGQSPPFADGAAVGLEAPPRLGQAVEERQQHQHRAETQEI